MASVMAGEGYFTLGRCCYPTTEGAADMYRRNLQKIYVEKLLSLVNQQGPPVMAPYNCLFLPTVYHGLKGQVRSLSTEIGKTNRW